MSAEERPTELSVTGRVQRRGGRGDAPMVPEMRLTSYYGHPVIKRPVWQPEIGLYFFTGGLGGGSLLLAAASRRQGDDAVARRALLTGVAAVAVSPLLLIKDLGKPSRFLNMLRVAKVTSPMSVGSWVLTGAGGFAGIAASCEVLGILPRVRDTAEAAAAVLGAPLSTYTAALIANTAVPVWHEARRELPVIFASTSLATAGAASLLMNAPSRSVTARRLCVGGAVGSLVGMQVMERALGTTGVVYNEGTPHTAGRLSKLLTAVGAATVALGGRRRAGATLGAAAVLAGGLLERWSIFKAGVPSAADPKFTVEPQRKRLDDGLGFRQSEDLASTGG